MSAENTESYLQRDGAERKGYVRAHRSFNRIWKERDSAEPDIVSAGGRTVYLYLEKDLRAYPGTVRGTDEWNDTYKIRITVERSINHFKDSFGIAGRKTQNEKTLLAHLILAGITQLIGVLLADKIQQHQYIRSLKPLMA